MPRLLSLLFAALIVAGCGASGPSSRAIPALTNPLLVAMDTEAARNYAAAFAAVDGYEGSTLWSISGGDTAQKGEQTGVVVIDPACGLRYATPLMTELNGGDPILAPAKNTGGGSSGLFHETRQEALIFIEGRGLASGASRPSSGCDERQWNSAERASGYVVARLRVIEGKTGENGARSGGTWVIEGYAAAGSAITIEVAAGFPSINPYGTLPSKVVAPDRLGRFRITDANAERVLRFATVGRAGTGLESGGRRIHWFRLGDIAPEWKRIAADSNCAAPYWAFWGHGLETATDGSIVGGIGSDGTPCVTPANVPIDTTLGFDANSVGAGFWLDAYAQMGIDPVTAATAKDGKRSNDAGDSTSFKDLDWTGVNKQIAIIAASANIGCTRIGLNPVSSGRDSYWVVDDAFNIRDPKTGVVRRATSAEAKLCKERALAGNSAVSTIVASIDPDAANATWLAERRLRLWCGVAVYDTAKTGGWYERSFKEFKGANDYSPNSIADDGAKAWQTGDADLDRQVGNISARTGLIGSSLFIDGSEEDTEGDGVTGQEVIDWLKDGRSIDDCADLLLRHRKYSVANIDRATLMAEAERLNGVPASMRDIGGGIASDVFGVVANTSTAARDYIYGRLGLASGKADAYVSIADQGGFVGQIASLSDITSGAVDAVTLSPSYIYSDVVDATGACEAFRDSSYLIGDLRDGYCPGSSGATDASGARIRVMSFSTAPEALPDGTRLGYKQAPLTKITITVTDSIGGGSNQSIYRSDWLPTRLVNRQSPSAIDINAGSDILSDPIGTITRGIEDWLYGIYRSTAGSWVSGLARGTAGNLIAVPAMEVYSVRFVAPDGTPVYRLSQAVVDGEDADPAVRRAEQAALLRIFGTDGTVSDADARRRAMGDPDATNEKARLGESWSELKYECTARARAGTIGEPPGATDGSIADFRSLVAVSSGGAFSLAACYELNPIRVAYDIVRSFGLFIAIAALCFYVIRRQIGVDTGVRPIAYAARWAGAVAVIFGIDIVARILGNVVGEAIVLTNIIGTQISGGEPYSHLWLFTSYLSTVQPGEGNIIVLIVMAIPSLIGLIFAFMVNAIRYGLTVVMMIIAPIWVVAILFGRSSRAFYGAIAFLLRLYLITVLSILFLLLLFAARRFIGLEDEASGNILSAVLNIVSLIALALVPWKLSSLIGAAVIEPLVGTLRGAINRADAITGEDAMSALTGKKQTGNTQTERIDAKRIGDGMANEAAKRASADGANGGSTTPGSGEPGSETERPKSVTERLASIAGGLAAGAKGLKEAIADPRAALAAGYEKSAAVAAALPGKAKEAAAEAMTKLSTGAKGRLDAAKLSAVARLNEAPTTAAARLSAAFAATRALPASVTSEARTRAAGLVAGATGNTGGTPTRDLGLMLNQSSAATETSTAIIPVDEVSSDGGLSFGPPTPAIEQIHGPELSTSPLTVTTPATPVVDAAPTPPLGVTGAALPFSAASIVGAQVIGSQVVLGSQFAGMSAISSGVLMGSAPLGGAAAAAAAGRAGMVLRRATSAGDFSLRAGETIAAAAAAGSPEIAAASAREIAAAAAAAGYARDLAASLGTTDASPAGIEAAAMAAIGATNGALRLAGPALMGGIDGSRSGALSGLRAAGNALLTQSGTPGVALASRALAHQEQRLLSTVIDGTRMVSVGAAAAARGAAAVSRGQRTRDEVVLRDLQVRSDRMSRAQYARLEARRAAGDRAPALARSANGEVAAAMIRRASNAAGSAVTIATAEGEIARHERTERLDRASGVSTVDGDRGSRIDGIRSGQQAATEAIGTVARATEWERAESERYETPEDVDFFDPAVINAWLETLTYDHPDVIASTITDRATIGDPIAITMIDADVVELLEGEIMDQARGRRVGTDLVMSLLKASTADARAWLARLEGIVDPSTAQSCARQLREEARGQSELAALLVAVGTADGLDAALTPAAVTFVVDQMRQIIESAVAGEEGPR
jgi:hypothetical protein